MSIAVRSRPRVGALLALGLFAVYVAGAAPTIYVGDSGELVTAVYRLGIPHPTGYPLYVLLGKLWTLLVPLGSIAYRMSLFSAACAALACAVVSAAARELGLGWPAALLSALLLAFSPSFWGEANVQRVYALNALFVALATYTALRWHRERAPQWCVATFLVCGLGAANHMFMAVYAGAFAAGVAARIAASAHRIGFAAALRAVGLVWGPLDGNPWRGGLRTLAASLGVFGLGLLPYLYLPIRSRADPVLNWGDPQTLDRFLNVVLRRGFWGRAFYEQPGDLLLIGRDYLSSFGVELTWFGAALALAGLAGGRARAWPRLLFALVMLGNVVVMAAHGSRSDLFLWHRYYVPSYTMAALLAGCGCELLFARAPAALRIAPLAIPALSARHRVAPIRSQSVLHRRRLLAHPTAVAAARRLADRHRRQHPVRADLPDDGGGRAPGRAPDHAGGRRRRAAADALQHRHQPALLHPSPELASSRPGHRAGRSRLPSPPARTGVARADHSAVEVARRGRRRGAERRSDPQPARRAALHARLHLRATGLAPSPDAVCRRRGNGAGQRRALLQSRPHL